MLGLLGSLRLTVSLHLSRLEGVQREALLGHPRVVQELAHVVACGVRQHAHDAAFLDVELLHGFHSARHAGAAAAADHHALAPDDGARHLEGLGVARLHPVVNHLPVQHRRNEVVADALDLQMGMCMRKRIGSGVDWLGIQTLFLYY